VKKRGERGFTLSELVVTLGVSAIIVVMLSIAIVNVSKINMLKAEQSTMFAEVNTIKQTLHDFYKQSICDGYDVIVSNEHALVCQRGEDNLEVYFGEDMLFYGEQTASFSTIESIKFRNGSNGYVICDVKCNLGDNYTFLL